MKCCSLAPFALYPEPSMVLLNDTLTDKQANTQSRIGLFRWINCLIKALKDFLVMGLINTYTKILDADERRGLVS